MNVKIFIDPSIKVKHFGGTSHDSTINKPMELSRNWHWMWSTFYYHRKHSGYLKAFSLMYGKLIRAFFKMLVFSLIYNRKKQAIYSARFFGLLNAMMGKKSWYRIKSFE